RLPVACLSRALQGIDKTGFNHRQLASIEHFQFFEAEFAKAFISLSHIDNSFFADRRDCPIDQAETANAWAASVGHLPAFQEKRIQVAGAWCILSSDAERSGLIGLGREVSFVVIGFR